jgi:hypothetical protein
MATQSVQFSNIAATPANFRLNGGVYSFRYVGTLASGSIVFNALGPDGSTLVGIKNLAGTAASVTTGTGVSGAVDSIWLPPGMYQVTLTNASGVYVNIASVPIAN